MNSLLKNHILRMGALFLILVIGMFIRSFHQDLYTYGADQIMHMQIIEGHNLAEVWQFSKNETHPPLFYFLLHSWLKISHDIAWIQIAGLIFYTGTIVLFYMVANKLQPGAGLIAALLAALCPLMVNMSQLIRHYSPFLMFVMAGLYCYLQFMEKKQGKWLAGYVVTGCLMVSTHFSAVIPLASMGAVALYYLYRDKNWRLLVLWMVGNGIAALLLLFFYSQISWTIFVYALPKTSFMTSLENIIPQFILLLVDYPPHFLPNFNDQLPNLLQNNKVAHVIITNLTKGLFVYFICPIIIESRKTQPLLFQITMVSLAVVFTLCLLQYYDTVPRHNIWLAPFIILPCSIWIYRAKDKVIPGLRIKLYPLILAWLAISTVLIPFNDNGYRKNDETMTKAEISQWRQVMQDHAPPGDIIVGGRNAIIVFYEYMLGRNYYRDLPVLKDKSYYISHHIDIRDMQLRATDDAGRSYISPAYEYTLMKPEDFDILFRNAISKGWLDNAQHIWFLSAFDANETLVDNLAACPKLKNEITYKFTHPGDRVLFFALPKEDVMDILKPDGKFRSCLQP